MGLGHINRAFFNDETARGFYGTTETTTVEAEKKPVTNGGLTSGVNF